jgi:glycosyltransferase involved in cell wall biosynthesis
LAQERKKTRIVLASILKPVDDTRMLEKMGLTLRPAHDVHIIGYPSSSERKIPEISLHPLNAFPRVSWRRLFAKWKVFAIAIKLRPDIFIITTHELLVPALWLKVFLPVKIVYDVRENYYRNILYAGSFPWVLRGPLALLVRWKEKLMAPMVDHFFLAERGYEQEIRFHRGGWTVLENKTAVHRKQQQEHPQGRLRLLFSGTLAESTGVLNAIGLARELFKLDPSVTLTIAGYAAMKSVRERILKEVKLNSFLRLVGGERLVPHDEILTTIDESDFGIIAYPPSRHTMNSVPTKLFEYLGAGLPVIVDRRWPWVKRYESINPFVFIDFDNIDYPGLLAELKAGRSFAPPEDVTWESEAPKLIDAIINTVSRR